MPTLDSTAVAEIDRSGQLREALELGTHLEDALWRVDSAAIPAVDAPGGLVVAGMGGSAVGGRLAAGVLGPRLRRPLSLTTGYGVPPWTGPGTLVLCSSYSGRTEETLAAYDAAGAAGAARIVATTGGDLAARARADGVPVVPLPGGFQPRAAVGYALVTALEAAALCGAAPSLRGEVAAAAALARELAAEWGPDGSEEGDAKRLAGVLDGPIPLVVGAELTAPVAYRWKTQLNENPQVPAFAGELPEHDHNELVAWAEVQERIAAVFLQDPEGDPRIARRFEVTAELAASGAAAVERIGARGATRLERLVSLVLLGDLVSLYLAVLRGVDPAPVDAIDRLKARLGGATG
jgi:glucose/mannose-6-phosphate isomerase